MPSKHRVLPGECLASIAQRHGTTADALWKDPGNADLRRARAQPWRLRPGDVVRIPARSSRDLAVKTGSTAQIAVTRGACLTVRLEASDPDAGARFTLESADGAYREERAPPDDAIPGDDCRELHFCGLGATGRYTLSVRPDGGGAPVTVFRDVPYAELADLSDGGPSQVAGTEAPAEDAPYPEREDAEP